MPNRTCGGQSNGCGLLTETGIIEERVGIDGHGRRLEGVLSYPSERVQCSALIAGPHPYLGGDMRNNVVAYLSRALTLRGSVTLTFNYGGVGASEGGPTDWSAAMSAFWQDGTFEGEGDWVIDTEAALTALQHWCDLPSVLIGYSFGCWTVAKNLDKSNPEAVVLISPNPLKHEFDGLTKCGAPLLVIHSDNDFACGAGEMANWFDSVRQPKARIQLPATEHFFRGHEAELTSTIVEFLKSKQVKGWEQRADIL